MTQLTGGVLSIILKYFEGKILVETLVLNYLKTKIKYFLSKCDQICRKLRVDHIYWRNT